MIHLLLSVALAGPICVKQQPTKEPFCTIQLDDDLVIEGKKCKTALFDNHKLEILWIRYSEAFEGKTHEAFWQCSWCWECKEVIK